MDMHSNSHDIQQKYVDGVPRDSMVITQQAVPCTGKEEECTKTTPGSMEGEVRVLRLCVLAHSWYA